VPMRGPRGVASMEAHAENHGRGWRLSRLRVVTDEDEPPLDLLAR
jgi:hypothetical protein